MRILVLGSYAPSLVGFRGQLIQDMIAAGHEVIACAPEDNPEDSAKVAKTLGSYGASYRTVKISRTATNPLRDLVDVISLWRLLRSVRADLLFAYTIKPVIYGTIAARIAGVPSIFAMITGAGYVFTEGGGLKRRLLRPLVTGLYRASLARTRGIFFHNGDDLAEFRNRAIVDRTQNLIRVHGSGVDIDHFSPAKPQKNPLIFLLIARLLVDKGVRDYVAAARRIKARHPSVRFQLLGPPDTTPSAIPADELKAWQEEGVIDYLGSAADVRPHIRACSVYVLPSYREGLPRTVLEAMAMGRAIVTTDAPGCRDTVMPGDNGFLVPVRDPQALADAMETFVLDPGRIETMGQASRRIAEERYDVRRVNAAMLEAMGLARAETRSVP